MDLSPFFGRSHAAPPGNVTPSYVNSFATVTPFQPVYYDFIIILYYTHNGNAAGVS